MAVVRGSFRSSQRSNQSRATGIVFAGRNGLDFLELRLGVVRIPEVSLRLREAQNILDRAGIENVDLMNAISSEDEVFFKNIKLKSFLSAIVQVGLYDRLLKTQKAPEVLIGGSNGDSALMVCAGQCTFEEMVKSSSVFSAWFQQAQSQESQGLQIVVSNSTVSDGGRLPVPAVQAPLQQLVQPSLVEAGGALPSLSGVGLTEYSAFVRLPDSDLMDVARVEAEDGSKNEMRSMDLKKLIRDVVEERYAQNFVQIGPCAALSTSDYEEIGSTAGADEVTAMDSIDLDPMLNWFWKEMRPVIGFAQ